MSTALRNSQLNDFLLSSCFLQELEVKEVRKSLTANSKEESAMQKKVTSKVCILLLTMHFLQIPVHMCSLTM